MELKATLQAIAEIPEQGISAVSFEIVDRDQEERVILTVPYERGRDWTSRASTDRLLQMARDALSAHADELPQRHGTPPVQAIFDQGQDLHPSPPALTVDLST